MRRNDFELRGGYKTCIYTNIHIFQNNLKTSFSSFKLHFLVIFANNINLHILLYTVL